MNNQIHYRRNRYELRSISPWKTIEQPSQLENMQKDKKLYNKQKIKKHRKSLTPIMANLRHNFEEQDVSLSKENAQIGIKRKQFIRSKKNKQVNGTVSSLHNVHTILQEINVHNFILEGSKTNNLNQHYYENRRKQSSFIIKQKVAEIRKNSFNKENIGIKFLKKCKQDKKFN